MKGGHRRIFGPPIDNNRKDRDEDLFLFHEMRRREKERSVNLLQPVSDDLESNSGNYPLYRIPSAKKGSGNDFFPFESNKNDYDWLKTPPATPLFPSLEMEASGPNLVIQKEIPILQSIKFSRFAGNSSSGASKPNIVTKSPNPKSSPSSRSVTPNPRPNVTSKPSTTKANSTTDTSKKPNISSITTKPTNPNQIISSNIPETTTPKNISNVSDTKPRSRGVSPLVRSRIPATIPGFSNETPPNLRTSAAASDRSLSASRGRPGNPTTGPGLSTETATNLRTTGISSRPTSASRGRVEKEMSDPKQEAGKARRQSCSPSMARGRRPEFKKEEEEKKGKIQGGNGVVLGSRMVEKVMNARRLLGGEEKEQRPKYRVSGGDGSGFGRMMSKSSLDMALKHMEIKRNSSNFHHYNTLSVRTSTATSCNSSLNLSPRTSHEEEFEEDDGKVKGSDKKTYPVKGVGRTGFGLC